MNDILLMPIRLNELETLIQNSVRKVLNESPKTIPQPETDQFLTVQKAAEFLTLSVPTIYGLISKGVIPCMKRSKRVYFSKAELINYLRQGKKKTTLEIGSEADSFLNKKKGGSK